MRGKKSENKLLEIVKQIEELNITNSMPFFQKDLNALKTRLEDDWFKIAVVGEFSAGKSTFINAIIGKDILTHAKQETTAAITHIYNVDKSDEKNGTCVIYYRKDIEPKMISKLTDLKEYTTLQFGENVVGDISHVDIFVNYLDSDYPLVIVDTPGLNGPADRHREITLKEIRQAHACIYLFSIKGVSGFDKSFIRGLTLCQSRFIFVQNFIDMIHVEEESEEEVLQAFDEEIALIFKGIDGVKFDTCGISGLKALVGRDTSISKLYNGDIDDLTPIQRQKIFADSHFNCFEKIIQDMMSSGEYLKVVFNTCKLSIRSMLNNMLAVVENQQSEQEKIIKEDDKNKIINQAKGQLKNICDNKEKQSQNIENFIIAKCTGKKKLLKNYIYEKLKNINEKINNKIREEVCKYSDIENIRKEYKKTMVEYYSEILSDWIDMGISNIEEYIKSVLSIIYKDAINKVSEYSGISIQNNNWYQIKKIHSEEEFEIKAEEYYGDIEKQKDRVNQEKAELSELKDAIVDKKSKIDSKNREIAAEQIERYTSEQEKQMEIKKIIGERPQYREWEEEIAFRVERTGLFHRVREALGEPRYEYKNIIRNNKDEIKEWERRFKELKSKIDARQDAVDRSRNTITKNIKKLESEIQKSEVMLEAKKARIDRLEASIEQKKLEHEIFIRNAQDEFTKTQRKHLIDQIEKSLWGEEGVYNQFCQYLESYIDENEKRIISLTRDEFLEHIEIRIERLNSIIANKSGELAKELAFVENDINTIRTLQQELERIIL